MSAWVALELEATEFAPGDEVAGRFGAKWTTRARAARAQLEYVEVTPQGTAVRIRGPRVVLPAGQLAGGETHPFALTLPADAAPTVVARDLESGTLVATVTWRVAVRLDRFGSDDFAFAPITVLGVGAPKVQG
jgi:hypothetical protein